jgi:hypothetical protein
MDGDTGSAEPLDGLAVEVLGRLTVSQQGP